MLHFQVFCIAYCLPFYATATEEYQLICNEFIDAVKEHKPELLMKQKVHLLLHLVQSLNDFGPSAGFNAERYGF